MSPTAAHQTITSRRLLTSLVLLLCSLAVPAYALEADRRQPATLDADQFDLDFQTGVRTYRGNVVYQQGSIRLTADEVVAYFTEDGALDKAVARGNPARFKQRPEHEPEDFIGTAMRIELNESTRLVTLETNATVSQGSDTVSGRKITYNLDTEKANVLSAPRQKAGDSDSSGGKSARPRLIIKPRQ